MTGKIKRKRAFTLAEVLITLGIIGIVAALTIPNLIAKYQEKAHLVRLKKVASELTNAFNLAVTENGTVDTWSNSLLADERGKAINNVLGKYLKYVRVCDHYSLDCASPAYHNLDGTKFWTTNPFDYFRNYNKKYFLANGAVILISSTGTCMYPESSSHYYGKCGEILVDTNGFKGPNRNGMDVFAFFLYQDRLLPVGTDRDHNSESFNACVSEGWRGTCTAWALYNNNMDYFHCRDELSWEGKRSCK